jgi:RNA polymerase sigma-70 factor (ECF subfamily)
LSTNSIPLPALLAEDLAAREQAAATGEPLVHLSDEALLERVARRDEGAFAALYRRYERPVFGVLLRLAGERATAEECLQEAFTRVWLAAATHDPARGRVKPWIFKVAINTARSELARKRHRTAHVSIDSGGVELDDGRGGEPRLSAELDEERQRRSLASAVSQLPDFMREVVLLRCSRELSFAEIAELTGAPQGTLKSRFHRAVVALRERLLPGRSGAL